MINVLLIAYYWPPSGGGGVHRWLKMSKYFPYDKMNLFVYTPENPEYPAYDESLSNEIDERIKVLKYPITEPYSFYKKFTGKKKDEKIYSGFINEKKSWKQNVAVWIRSNFFIPDARFLWIKPSIKHLKNHIENNKIDVVISTGPPHSMHLIAKGLKKSFPQLKWIADFRDPWTEIDFYEQLKLTKWADNKHRRLEQEVIDSCDLLVTVSNGCAEGFKRDNSEKIIVIPNGYDHANFSSNISVDKAFNLAHLGSINADRNPSLLWKVMKDLKSENPSLYEDLSIQLIGNVDGKVASDINENDINNLVDIQGFVDHKIAIELMQKSFCLLLLINNTKNAKGILTGKMFEYMGSGRPIICIGPEDGDAKEVLDTVENAFYFDYNNYQGLKECLLGLYNQFKNGNDLAADVNEAMKFSRKSLANDYFELIEKISN